MISQVGITLSPAATMPAATTMVRKPRARMISPSANLNGVEGSRFRLASATHAAA